MNHKSLNPSGMEPADEDVILEAAPDDNGEEGLGAESETHLIRIRRKLPGRRLDKFLQTRFPRISRTTVQGFIKQGQVTVNSMPTKASYEPRVGDEVRITLPPPPPSELTPVDIPLNIVHEDDWLLILNKPAGIVCHPAFPGQTNTLANAAAFHAEKLSRGSDPFRPGILHRLDKNTTGILVIAKSDEAHWRLSLQFERRTVSKQYFAVCDGSLSNDTGVINKPLAPVPSSSPLAPGGQASPPRQAMFKEAVTEYRVRKRYRGFTAVDLFPKTGRTHQLRVHLASIGNPITGDERYGGRAVSDFSITGEGSQTPFLSHQALHALRLKFMHPILEKPMEVEAPYPETILHLVELLDRSRS